MGRRGNRSRRRSGQNTQSGRADASRGKSGNRGGRRRSRGPFDPDKHYLPDPVPQREYEPCPITGQEIEDIYTAIAEPASGRPARFDGVIEHIRATERIPDDSEIIYLGRGAFGVVTFEKGQSGRKEMIVHERFQYEDSHESYVWRRELAPGISRDYKPQPQPIYELYTTDEIAAFPRFEPASSYQMRG